MKMLSNNSQLKEQENSSEGANNQTDLYHLTNTKFKNVIVKILKELRAVKELRADRKSKAGYFRKELENIRMSKEKLENSFVERQAELKH